MNHRFRSTALLALAAACGGQRAANVAGSVVGSSQPSVAAASAQHVATAPPSAAGGGLPELPGPTFHLVNETNEKISLLKLGGGVVASGGAIFAKVSDAGIERDERFGEGLPSEFWVPVTGLAGSFPDDLWATVIQSNGRTGWGELYRRGKQRWSRVGGALPQTRVYVGIGNWSGGRVLAMQAATMPIGQQVPFSFQIVSGPPAPLPVPTPAPTSPDRDPNEQCKVWKTLVIPQALAILPSGDVFAVGPTCDQNAQAVEHWAPGQTHGRVFVFPESSDWYVVRVLARAEREVVIAMRTSSTSLLARFDGAAWTTEPLAVAGQLVDADLAADGTLFVVSQAEDRELREGQAHQPKSASLPGRLWWRRCLRRFRLW